MNQNLNLSPTAAPMPVQSPAVRRRNFEEVALGYDEITAMEEARRCLDCPGAPCRGGCPVGVHIPQFIAKVAEGDFAAAWEILSADNTLPAVCGRVCPQENQCQAVCVRGKKGESVAIGRLERFVADWHRAQQEPKAPSCAEEKGKKVAVVGSGPAGLACAGELARMGYSVTVFEALHTPGGVLAYGIPAFRLPKDILHEEIAGLEKLGVTIQTDTVIGRTIPVEELLKDGFSAVFLGSGAGLPNFMGIPGETLCGVFSANEWLTRINLMHAAEPGAATPLMPAKHVVVVGGGNVAMDAARCALRCGAEKVSLYCLEDYDSMPMGVEDRTECEEDGIEIHAGWGQTEILAENGRCSGIRFRKCLSVRNAEGRFAPTFDDNTTEEVPCDMVLYCIGQKVDWKGLLTGTAVELNPNGTAKADPVTYQTAEPDLFVGGDVYTGQKFAIDAIAAGKQGAVSLHRWVQDATLTIGRDKREFIELDKNNLLLEEASYDNTPRQRIGYNETLRKTFKDGRVAFTEEQVKAETARCLGCGASVVDPNKCIGCGICTTRCAFDAIHLHRDLPECSTMRSAEDKMKGILPYMIKRKIRIRRAKKAEKRNG